MLKIALIAACSAAFASAVTVVFVGRSTYSTVFQADLPFNSAFKVTPDPGNIWSWHHTFTHPGWGATTAGDVLVDINGDLVMDTVHAEVRVMITDLQVVGGSNQDVWVRVFDSVGKRLAVGTKGPMQHVNLTTPLVLPVGSSLRVEVTGAQGDYDVHMIGRVVNP